MLCSAPKSANSITCERNQPGLQSPLLSFSDLVRNLILLRTPGNERLFRKGKFGDRRQNASPNCSHQAANFWPKVAQCTAETESDRWKLDGSLRNRDQASK